MNNTIVDFLQYFTYFSLILPLIVFLFFHKKNRNTLSRVIFIYLIYTLINEVVLIVIRELNFAFSFSPILYALYTIFEYVFLGYYLYSIIKHRKFKITFLICSLIFLIIALINLYQILFSHRRSQLIDSIPLSTSAVILIIFSILFLFEEIQSPRIGFIYSSPKFWIVVGIMIYFSGTFFYFLQFADFSAADQDNYWTINLLCMVLKNIFFSISFSVSDEDVNQSIYDNSYGIKF